MFGQIVSESGSGCFCDGLMAAEGNDGLRIVLLSLFGRASSVDVASNRFVANLNLPVSWNGKKMILKRWEGISYRIQSRFMASDVMQTVIVAREALKGIQKDEAELPFSAVVYGPDEVTCIRRAFILIKNSITTPLKSSWADWLWNLEGLVHRVPLTVLGDYEAMREAYFFQWASEAELTDRILKEVSLGSLT